MAAPEKFAGKLLVLTLWLLPFYLPLSVWLASSGVSIYVLSAWKELVLAVLLVMLTPQLLRLLHTPDKITRLLNMSIFAYVILCGLYVFGADNLFEYAAGFLFATRFLLFFLAAQVLARVRQITSEHILRISLVGGVALASIALLQALVLPPTLLTHLGYEHTGQDIRGIPPAVTTLGEIDDFVRPQASLRGPNPLGAFLILPSLGFLYYAAVRRERRGWMMGGWVLVSVALAGTFSRSAWLGWAAASVLLVIGLRRRLSRRAQIGGSVVAAMLLVTTLVAGTQTETGRFIVFREDRTAAVSAPDTVRASLSRTALQDVAAHPMGHGPGNAGPVSALDAGESGRIAENYYLQVAQEVGWLGLGLFVAIQILLFMRLYRLRGTALGWLALVSLLGLVVSNLLQHTWADDAVAILWWSFAGAVIGLPVAARKQKSATLETS